MFCLHTCLNTICVSGALRGQKRALDLLQLELQTFMSHYVGARNWTRVPCWSSKHILLLSHLCSYSCSFPLRKKKKTKPCIEFQDFSFNTVTSCLNTGDWTDVLWKDQTIFRIELKSVWEFSAPSPEQYSMAEDCGTCVIWVWPLEGWDLL